MWLGGMNHAVLQSKVYLTSTASYRRWLGLLVVANYAYMRRAEKQSGLTNKTLFLR